MREDDWNKKAKTYKKVEWTTRTAFIGAIADAMSLQQSDTVLDAGAGTGPISTAIAPLVDYVYALDKSKAMLEKMPALLNVVKVIGDITSMRFKDEMFDKIVMRQVLHLVDEPIVALRECHRVLKTGGYMALVEGIAPHPDLEEWFSAMLKTTRERHVFTTDEMYDFIEEAGFAVVGRTVWVEPQVSINNWLKYSRVGVGKRQKIMEMHLGLDGNKKKHYNMTVGKEIRCDFHCLILVGQK